MDKSFHYLLMINESLFKKKVFHQLAETELTRGQPKVLDYLRYHDGSIQKEIAYGCQIEPATLTVLLKNMAEKGLIERRCINGNNRSNYIYLTENGKAKAEIVAEAFLEIENEVFKGFNSEEKKQFMELFYKICSNMIKTEKLQ